MINSLTVNGNSMDPICAKSDFSTGELFVFVRVSGFPESHLVARAESDASEATGSLRLHSV